MAGRQVVIQLTNEEFQRMAATGLGPYTLLMSAVDAPAKVEDESEQLRRPKAQRAKTRSTARVEDDDDSDSNPATVPPSDPSYFC